MRVLLVSSGSGSRGGGEIFLDYLGRGLTERGHEVVMWIPSHPRMDELAGKCASFAHIFRSDYRNTYDHPTRSLGTCFNWRVPRRIAREWRALEPEVIHINKQNLEDGLDLLRATQFCASPSVCTIHLTQTATYLWAKAAWLRDSIARWQLRRYQGSFVTVQEGRHHALRDFLGGRPIIKTIFYGVPITDSANLSLLRRAKRKELGLSDSELLVLGIGRLVDQKRPLLFLRLAKELHQRVRSARFLWIGDGKLIEEWHKTVAREQIGDVVSCAGWQRDVLPYLAAGDLLLHVAAFEGFPFAVIEAMAAQLACCVMRELSREISILNDDNVLFADDIESLAANISNRNILANIAVSGRRLAEKKLSSDTMAKSYEKLYLDAIQQLC